jgi:hypothetical protein
MTRCYAINDALWLICVSQNVALRAKGLLSQHISQSTPNCFCTFFILWRCLGSYEALSFTTALPSAVTAQDATDCDGDSDTQDNADDDCSDDGFVLQRVAHRRSVARGEDVGAITRGWALADCEKARSQREGGGID